MTHPDAQRAFEEMMPEPDIRIDAFGEIAPTDRRLFVRGDFFSAEQMRKMFEAGRASVTMYGAESFEQWAKERGHPLCDVVPKYGPASSSPETVLRFSDIAREAWDAATERAAKVCEDEIEQLRSKVEELASLLAKKIVRDRFNRSSFEAMATSAEMSLTRNAAGNGYAHHITQVAWDFYQAATKEAK